MGTYSSTKFAGTDVSGSHIGDTEAKRLAGLLSSADTTPGRVVLTAGAEVANAIAVDVALTDSNGDPLKRNQILKAQVLDPNGLLGLVADWTMAQTGAGAEISATAQPTLLLVTDENGNAQVTVTDVSAAFAGSVFLVVECLDRSGSTGFATLTFA